MVYVRSLQPEEDPLLPPGGLPSPRSPPPLSPSPSHFPGSFDVNITEEDTDRLEVNGTGEMVSELLLKGNFWKSVDYALISSCAPVNDASTTTEKVTKE